MRILRFDRRAQNDTSRAQGAILHIHRERLTACSAHHFRPAATVYALSAFAGFPHRTQIRRSSLTRNPTTTMQYLLTRAGRRPLTRTTALLLGLVVLGACADRPRRPRRTPRRVLHLTPR